MTAAERAFRKRRLSLPRHHVSTDTNSTESLQKLEESASSETSPSNTTATSNSNHANTFRKRRLSLTLVDAEEPVAQRARRGSVASTSSATSLQSSNILPSRTLHAGELLHSMPSPAGSSTNNVLYLQQPLPPLPPVQDTNSKVTLQPNWKKRHVHHDEEKWPFPKQVVGIYSCHGIEPVYESDYEENEQQEEEWLPEEYHAADQLPLVSNDNVNETPTMVAKINQDRGGVAYPYAGSNETALFAVYDGHGQGGELVSQFALHEIQKRLEKHSDFGKNIERAMKEVFCSVDSDLKKEALIEPLYAGTTACVALLQDRTLTLANTGDSRAIIARFNHQENGGYYALDLTTDQNPDLPDEMQRILSAGGYVSPPPGPGLSARVWLDAEFSQIGLAMARSIGDHAVSKAGVIAEPVVTTHEVDDDDHFMVLASDGVWEFLSSDEVVNIVAETLDRGATKACQAVIERAASAWHDEEGEYRDDITAIIVKLHDLWPDQDRKSHSRQKINEK